MDPALLAQALESAKQRGKLPKAVVPKDLYGQCADYQRIFESPLGVFPDRAFFYPSYEPKRL